MHIIGLLLGLMGTIGVILWHLNSAAGAVKGLAETAGDVQALVRRSRWRKKADVDLLTAVDDARIAGVGMMVALAETDGNFTSDEHAAIVKYMIEEIDIKPAQADQLVAHARWMVKGRELDTCFRKLFPVVQKTCTAPELNSFLDALDRLASISGPAGLIEADAIARLRRATK